MTFGWPIFVISLSDATGRRASISSALAERGLDFTFIDAVDGRRGLSPDAEAMIDRPGTIRASGRPMADTEYGCALSHMGVYRRIVDDGLPGALVLEDDAILTPLFDEFLAADGHLAGDLVQLDHLHGDIWRAERPRALTDTLRLARAARNASLTTGYTISRKGARYFLEHGLPLTRPADWPADPVPLDALLCVPRAVDHPPFDGTSNIEIARAKLKAAEQNGPRALRFLKASYWRRWWFKRRTKRVS
ncbi:hypothetical protein GQ651_02325 [Alphaproteobacteria bacterium GH1-50]|uniref:Glycosyl transferase family 25 domain-containing protein n=1 Tax=Kangsaoukella pontilimi TaxID=2691042 RepID=A0A7C9MV90_9RHOB|nr:glycosyltransferase family 25 protein [Kangsaoukella pontilimi]MXQ06674.1 hypothetical protein [Kangsaoukella pontilimi]